MRSLPAALRLVALVALVPLASWEDVAAGDRVAAPPYEQEDAVPRRGPAASPASRSATAARVAAAAKRLDALVAAAQARAGLEPAPACSDAVFLRRVHLCVTGTPPEPDAVVRFLDDPRPDKRAVAIDALLEREEAADYAALRWCDVLRVKSEFPINLWPNAVQAYHRWVRDALRANVPFDRFARDLLTSSGSNFRVPSANFWRAVQGRDAPALASAVALTFLGERVEGWTPERRAAFEVFFSRVAWKRTGEWKEEIVLTDPAPAAAVAAVLPDGTAVTIPAGADPRAVFADWLLAPGNPSFARVAANREWAWLFGRGIVHEPDDFRPENPPSLPEALSFLAKELVESKHDLRHVRRVILNSRTWQQSPVPRGDLAESERLFACHPVRRLDAEVLQDLLCWIGGDGVGYTSVIPEPWTWVPEGLRTVTLADGSVTSPFLELFGRPARDTGRFAERNDQTTDAQRLHLLNSSDVRTRIERSPRLAAVLEEARGDVREVVRGTYLVLLSRPPVAAEISVAETYFRERGRTPREAAADLAWALVNSKEFLHLH